MLCQKCGWVSILKKNSSHSFLGLRIFQVFINLYDGVYFSIALHKSLIVLFFSNRMNFILFRNKSVDFKNHLHSAFDDIPEYGNVFAIEMNRKFFRAIRIDTEVSPVRLFIHYQFMFGF